MSLKPLITLPGDGGRISAAGETLVLHEWAGSGPAQMHVHHSDDEAWHVLTGVVTFTFEDRVVEAPAGSTVFVPAGVSHTYVTAPGTRYLIFLTPRLAALISALQTSRDAASQAEIYRAHDSELLTS